MRVATRSHILYLVIAAVALALLLPCSGLAQAPEPHKYIEEYNGPETCEMCHAGITDDVIHTVHYTWEEKMDHYSPIPATIARINWLGILNSELNIPGGCGRCHIGDGSLPMPPDEVTAAEKAGIDCLICHSPTYDTSLRFPERDDEGNWKLTQDQTLMSARQAQRPPSQNCLLCHQNVEGGPLIIRGVDFAPVADRHGETSVGDYHADAGFDCVDCHESENHKVTGFGPTLFSRDLPDDRLLCDTCHTSTPHGDPILNNHLRLDCRACHVQSTGGLIHRDWTAEPDFDPITELFSPVSDVQPPNSVPVVFRWFDGGMAKPDEPWPGDRADENSRIQPFKEYTGIVPVDADSGIPIPLKLDPFFTEGDLEKAILVGAEQSDMDYSGSWEPKELTTYIQISHGTAGGDAALSCPDCHVADGVMDFEALGYTADEVTLFTSLSSADAGVRQPLKMNVVVPEPVPLPTPVVLSGEVEAGSSEGMRISFNPWLAALAVIAILGGVGFWLSRQRPPSKTKTGA
ncbi:MAG: hypothetical protein U9R25_01425 [Chloroflexota bacterium]|nr:hypothetical protein [Chloroflexota bacterium]